MKITVTMESEKQATHNNGSKSKSEMTNPNPRPELHPHPSSIDSLCDYIDDQIIYLRRHFWDEEMEYYAAEHRYVFASEAGPSSDDASASASTPSFDPYMCTAGGPFLSRFPCTLEPCQREQIELYIPPTLLRLPLMMRACGLRAWYETLYQSEARAKKPLIEPQRKKRKKRKCLVMPWDEGVTTWKGSFEGNAVEVARVPGLKGGERVEMGAYRRVKRRTEDVSNGDDRNEEGAGGGMEKTFDAVEGHVMGFDWACGKGGPTVLVHEQKETKGNVEKERKDSVLVKVVRGAQKGAVFMTDTAKKNREWVVAAKLVRWGVRR